MDHWRSPPEADQAPGTGQSREVIVKPSAGGGAFNSYGKRSCSITGPYLRSAPSLCTTCPPHNVWSLPSR